MRAFLNQPGREAAGCRAGARRFASLLVVLVFSLALSRTHAAVITSASADVINQALLNAANGETISLQFNGDVLLNTTLSFSSSNIVIDATGFNVTLDGGGTIPIFMVPAGLNCLVRNVGFIRGSNIGTAGIAGTQGGTGSNGNGQAGGPGGNGFDAQGGGILNQGTLTLVNCVVGTNVATGGVGGSGGNGGNGTFAGNGGPGGVGGNGYGGGIYNDASGILVLSNCTVTGNAAFGANGGPGGTNGAGAGSTFSGSGGVGGAGSGAGIYNLGMLTIWNSTFESNSAVSGASQAVGANPSNGRGLNGLPGTVCRGASVFNQGTGAAINCTFFGNVAIGGTGGNGGGGFPNGNGGNGGNASGGAIYNAGGLFSVTNCTFAASMAIGGTNGAAGGSGATAGAPGSSLGNNLANNAGATFQLKNTLLTNNSVIIPGTVASGTFVDQGNNLSSDATPAFTAVNSHNNVNPRLQALANNGGPTLTMALLSGSAAISHADSTAAPPFDQRGFARKIATGPDIGAYESGASSNNIFSISGVVTTDGSSPVGGVSVSASGLISTTTDTSGRYTFGSLVSNAYTLNVQPSGFFAPASMSVTVGPTNATNANFVASPLGRSNLNGFASVTVSTNSTRSNRLIQFSFSVLTNSLSANRAYFLEASTNLASPTNWQVIASNVPTGTNLFTLTITNQFTNNFFSIPITNGFTNSPRLFLRTVTP